jgi:hypothetical protein
MLSKHVTVYTPDGNLGSKFHRRSSFASNNRTNVWLSNADNAVIHPTLTLLVHPLLLSK